MDKFLDHIEQVARQATPVLFANVFNREVVLALVRVARAANKSWLNAHTARRFDDELNEALIDLEALGKEGGVE